MKKETLNDFIKKESKSAYQSVGIIKGAEWQAERSYSEEEVKNILFKFSSNFDLKRNIEITLEEQNKWFEQFKKK
jgi:hypothetical protein